MTKIILDLNVESFQEQLFKLEKLEQRALLNTLKKIQKMSWEELYVDKGIRWELIASIETPKGKKVYSFRFSQKYRCTAFRDTDYLVLLKIHPDHDSAYK